MTKILFICHGNICRSPMAEFIMKQLVAQADRTADFEIASAAVSTEEIGNDIYPPAKRMLASKGVPFEHHAARQMTRADYAYYDHIVCMDQSNLRWMRYIIGEDTDHKVSLMMAWAITNHQSPISETSPMFPILGTQEISRRPMTIFWKVVKACYNKSNRLKMSKIETYQSLLPQIESLISGESDPIANMANVAAALHEAFGFWWTGFYRVDGQQLVLGPFQGPIACTRIPYGKGVCGTAWQRAETVIVPNVHDFPGHIACSSASNSEIVVPLIRNNQVVAVLDIDSKDFNTFDETDQLYLEKIAEML